jgi:hypothetical protein
MLRTTPLQPSIALDRNQTSLTKQGEGEEEVGKKKLQLSHSSIQTKTYRALPVFIQYNHRKQVLTTRR